MSATRAREGFAPSPSPLSAFLWLAAKGGRELIIVIQTAFGFWHATTIPEPKMSASPLKTAGWMV
jgi:hypothetical protein